MHIEKIVGVLQEEFKEPKIKGFDEIIEVGKVPPQELREMLLDLPDNKAINLDPGFFPEAKSRNVRKYGIPIKLKRYTTKRKAIEDMVTPFRLYDEALEKARRIPEKTYIGFSWRGISRGESKNKNFLVTSLVQGYIMYNIIKQIKTGLYFKLSKLQAGSYERRIVGEQIRQLKGYTPKGLDKVGDIIINKGGKISGALYSKNYKTKDKLYKIVIENVPIAYSAKDKECYAVWFDLKSRHESDEKRFFLSYIRPREEWFDSYDIALMFLAFDNNFREWRTRSFSNDPYIVFNPFPMPSRELVKLDQILRKKTFKRHSGTKRHVPLTKAEEEILLTQFLISGVKLY